MPVVSEPGIEVLQGTQGCVEDERVFQAAGTRMRPRVCMCCGEEIKEQGNALSRNPNVCASCSSLADGMDESAAAKLVQMTPEPSAPSPPLAEAPPAEPEVVSTSRE